MYERDRGVLSLDRKYLGGGERVRLDLPDANSAEIELTLTSARVRARLDDWYCVSIDSRGEFAEASVTSVWQDGRRYAVRIFHPQYLWDAERCVLTLIAHNPGRQVWRMDPA